MIKGAWLNSKQDLVGNFGSFSGQGRAAPELSLTEELTGSSPAAGPVNFTVPYIDQYLVIITPCQPSALITSLLTSPGSPSDLPS